MGKSSRIPEVIVTNPVFALSDLVWSHPESLPKDTLVGPELKAVAKQCAADLAVQAAVQTISDGYRRGVPTITDRGGQLVRQSVGATLLACAMTASLHDVGILMPHPAPLTDIWRELADDGPAFESGMLASLRSEQAAIFNGCQRLSRKNSAVPYAAFFTVNAAATAWEALKRQNGWGIAP